MKEMTWKKNKVGTLHMVDYSCEGKTYSKCQSYNYDLPPNYLFGEDIKLEDAGKAKICKKCSSHINKVEKERVLGTLRFTRRVIK